MAKSQGKIRVISRASAGMNNLVDPATLPSDYQTGLVEDAYIVNMDVNSTGRRIIRPGSVQKRSDSYDYLHAREWRDFFLVVNQTTKRLEAINPDSKSTTVLGYASGNRMAYVDIEARTYFNDGMYKGYIDSNLQNIPWILGDYYGPRTDRKIEGPPLGNFMELYRGHIFVAKGDVVYFNLYAAMYNYWDLAEGFFHMEGEITMLSSIEDGLYVGTKKGVFFLRGGTPFDFTSSLVYPGVPIPGSVIKIKGTQIGLVEYTGPQVVFATDRGICLGLPGGQVVDLTERKIARSAFPDAISGSAEVLNEQLVFLYQS